MSLSSRVIIKFLVVLPIAAGLFGCKTANSGSTTSTVEIPQTPVKNKKKVGFCWAYASTDFFESEYKKSSGKEINISEEAIGFYRIAEHLYEITQKSSSADEVAKTISCERFQGLHVMQVTPSQRAGAFELAARYGVVPESVYPVKFLVEDHRQDTFLGIKERILGLAKTRSPKDISLEEIINQVIVRPEGSDTKPSVYLAPPPNNFTYEGVPYTAQGFFTKFVGVQASEYVRVEFKKSSEYDSFIRLVKTVLGSGYSIPFSMGVDRNRLFREGSATVFSGKKKQGLTYTPTQDTLKGLECPGKVVKDFSQGRHVVLITDFVNIGGKEGKLESMVALRDELAKPASQLDYIKVKNNWGIDENGDEEGSAWLSSLDGYYRVDRQYLEGSLKGGVSLSVTVPKRLAMALGIPYQRNLGD